MNVATKIDASDAAPFKLRATLEKPVHCFAVRLDALLRVRPFISTEAYRYYLNGVYVHAHADGGAICAATDGHRLGVRRDTKGLVAEPQIVTLPKELKAPPKSKIGVWAVMTRTGPKYAHLSLVERVHDADHDTAENAILRVDECYQRFGDVLIDGMFPDYTRTLPSEGEGDVIRSFNGKYFGSFGDRLTIRGGGDGSPHLVFDHADQDFIGVLMPMRTEAKGRQDWTKTLAYPAAPAA